MAQQSFSQDRRMILSRGKPAPGSQVFLPWGDALQVETVSESRVQAYPVSKSVDDPLKRTVVP
jgi:hypothetical protein